MNLILFSPEELTRPLPRTDPRSIHLLGMLGRGIGDSFDAGLINGPRGKGVVTAFDDRAITLSFSWAPEEPPPPSASLLIGLPRPQSARDILRDATTLGATELHFVRTGRSDPNYQTSRLWTTGEWQRHVIAGAEQAFDTRIPEVSWTATLEESMARLSPGTVRVALDNYEATEPVTLSGGRIGHNPVALAFGPERGWSAEDRALLRAHGFTLAHLGVRVLRTETAVVSALALLRAGREPLLDR